MAKAQAHSDPAACIGRTGGQKSKKWMCLKPEMPVKLKNRGKHLIFKGLNVFHDLLFEGSCLIPLPFLHPIPWKMQKKGQAKMIFIAATDFKAAIGREPP
jgi:hypothetical protein